MTSTDVRETLQAVRDGVVVPPLDHVELRARAGRLRRRRRAVRGAVGVAAAAAVATTVVLLPGLPSGTDGLDGSDGSARSVTTADPSASTEPGAPGVPVVLDGRVELLQDDGELTGTGLSGTPVGWLDGRQVVLDGDRLLGVQDRPVTGVTSAFADSSGVSYQRTDGRIHWSGDGGHDLPAAGTLLAAGANGFVVASSSGVVLHDADGPHPVDLGSDGAVVRPEGAEVAGGTAVVVADGSEQFFDLDGTRRASLLGGGTGALSADGATWAYARDAAERSAGMRPGLSFYDTSSGATTAVPLAGDAVDLSWYDGDLYVLTQQDDTRTLWQCDDGGCDARLTRPGGALALR